jgi:hypothetical protein
MDLYSCHKEVDTVSSGDFFDEYERGTHPSRKYAAEHPTSRGLKGLQRIWERIRPGLVDRDIVPVPTTLPKDIQKWAVLPDWVELMVKYPFKGRNMFEWMDSWVPKGGHVFRGGAMTLRRRADRKTARIKQNGQGLNDPTPAFTFHGDRMEYAVVRDMLIKEMNRAHSAGEYPNEELFNADVEGMEGWNSAMGGRCGSYVFAEASILFTGMTPHQETGAPVPWDIFWEAWNDGLETDFPGSTDGPILKPKHLFVGVGNSPGVRIQNKEASGGYPATNMGREEVQSYIGRPKFTGRPTKGVVFPAAMRAQVRWIRAGMPMSGPEYREMAQPATLAYRGDREVDLDIRALGTRGPIAEYHESADQLAALNPGRSVIIVATNLVLAQSSWAQPMGDYIAGSGAPSFDWVDPWHSADRLDQLRRGDLDQQDGTTVLVGADASGWDRDVTPQMHAGETARYCALFPKEVTSLVVDAELPIDVSDDWVAGMLSAVAEGEEIVEMVTGIRNDGVEVTVEARVSKVSFDFHEYICKIMTFINDSPIAWGDYEVDAPGVEYNLSGALPRLKGLSIVSNGGRTSGDAATGIGNSDSNNTNTRAEALMSQRPELKKLMDRRAALQGEPPGSAFEVVDMLSRGDDMAVLVSLRDGGASAMQAVASAMCATGLRANAKKQESSDRPRYPMISFANVFVTEEYMGKQLSRTGKRYMVQESAGLDKATLDVIREEAGDLDVEIGIMTTTTTAISRLAPLAGFPLLDTHPSADFMSKLAVHNDRYRLTYLDPSSFEDGAITAEGREKLARAKAVEAKAQAKLRARRENVSVDLDALTEVYMESTIHGMIETHALDDQYNPTMKMEEHSNIQDFRDLTSSR